MQSRYLAVVGALLALPPATAFAQANMMHEYHEQMAPQQQMLHNDARDFRDLNSGELAKLISDYRRTTEPFRQNAMQFAEQARTTPLPAGSGARIRDALEADLTLWRNSLPVSGRDWDAMRKQWLVPVDSLSDQQWAQQRAAWYTARDAWLNQRLDSSRLDRH